MTHLHQLTKDCCKDLSSESARLMEGGQLLAAARGYQDLADLADAAGDEMLRDAYRAEALTLCQAYDRLQGCRS